MRRASRLHFGDIGKSLSLAFVAITVIWGVVSYYSLGRVYVSWQILLGNLAISATLSALYYRYRYHRVLEYDGRRFILHTGSRSVEGAWKDFSFISLYHKGFGVFAVRLYRSDPDEKDFVELPAGDIGLDPSAFRFELMRYRPGASPDHS
jgi:hypothetical protein